MLLVGQRRAPGALQGGGPAGLAEELVRGGGRRLAPRGALDGDWLPAAPWPRTAKNMSRNALAIAAVLHMWTASASIPHMS